MVKAKGKPDPKGKAKASAKVDPTEGLAQRLKVVIDEATTPDKMTKEQAVEVLSELGELINSSLDALNEEIDSEGNN